MYIFFNTYDLRLIFTIHLRVLKTHIQVKAHLINQATMAARNADSMTNAQGEFHPRQPRSEPLETGGVSFLSLSLSLPLTPPQSHLPNPLSSHTAPTGPQDLALGLHPDLQRRDPPTRHRAAGVNIHA